MVDVIPLFEINPDLDMTKFAAAYAADGRAQIRDILTPETAQTITGILARETPWGLAWQCGGENGGTPKSATADILQKRTAADWQAFASAMAETMQGRDYGFVFGQYPMLNAYLEKWHPGGVHDLLLEHLNSEPFLTLARTVTGIDALIKADAQATLYAANHFLGVHNDSHVAQGWRVAYVLNMCPVEWRPEWGGYLLFHDADGDISKGYLPRFNTLNLFAVPQSHSVSFVPPFAPAARYAITGWLRDR